MWNGGRKIKNEEIGKGNKHEEMEPRKFVMFLKDLYKSPNHYKKIVINSSLEDSETGDLTMCGRVEYKDMDIRKHLDYVWGIVASHFISDVCSYEENDEELWFFFFHDDSRLGEVENICMRCYKAGQEVEEAK